MNPWNNGDSGYGAPLPPPVPSQYPHQVPPPSPYYGQQPPPPPQPYYGQQPSQPYPMPPARPVMPPPLHAHGPMGPPVPLSPYPPAPPPRRPSRRPFVTLFLIALVVLGVAVIGLTGHGRSRPRSAPAPTPTSLPTVPTGSPGAGDEGPQKLGDNPLFGATGPKSVTCTLPRWQSVPAASNAYFTAALPCLDQAWQPVLKSVNLPFHEPKLAFPSGKTWSSPCGSVSQEEAAAFYCNGDQTLYMPMSGLQTDEIGDHAGAYLAVFAHEYGHFVQDLSGVLTAAHEQEYGGAGPDSASSLEVSRRLELQAQCFSGLFLAAAVGRGSVDDTVARDAQNTQERGDQPGQRRDHGTSEHTSGWWTQGFVKKTVAQCNTWLASSADVQ